MRVVSAGNGHKVPNILCGQEDDFLSVTRAAAAESTARSSHPLHFVIKSRGKLRIQSYKKAKGSEWSRRHSDDDC
jgi:hypothetical protein